MQPPARVPGNIPGVTFGGIALPSSDFQAVRDGRRAPMFYVDVDLTSARTFAAGSQLNLPIAANFLYVDQKANSGQATIHFQDQNGNATPITMLPGALWRVPFTQIALENTAQSGSTMRLVYGVDVDALPISAAAGVTVLNTSLSVTPVDVPRAATVAGTAFYNQATCAAVAAQTAQVQLFNPAASGKRLVLRKFYIATAAAGLYLAGFYNTALVTSSRAGLNKLSGGAAGAGLVKTEADPAGVHTIAGAMFTLQVPSTANYPVELAEPIVLTEGKGFLIQDNALNQQMRAGFEYVEETL